MSTFDDISRTDKTGDDTPSTDIYRTYFAHDRISSPMLTLDNKNNEGILKANRKQWMLSESLQAGSGLVSGTLSHRGLHLDDEPPESSTTLPHRDDVGSGIVLSEGTTHVTVDGDDQILHGDFTAFLREDRHPIGIRRFSIHDAIAGLMAMDEF